MAVIGEHTCNTSLLNTHLKGNRFYFLKEHAVKDRWAAAQVPSASGLLVVRFQLEPLETTGHSTCFFLVP